MLGRARVTVRVFSTINAGRVGCNPSVLGGVKASVGL